MRRCLSGNAEQKGLVHQMTILGTIFGFVTGGGIGWFTVKTAIKAAIKEAIKEDLTKIETSIEALKISCEKEDAALHERISNIKHEYVTCEYCKVQNDNTARLFSSIDHKLDMLLDHNMR